MPSQVGLRGLHVPAPPKLRKARGCLSWAWAPLQSPPDAKPSPDALGNREHLHPAGRNATSSREVSSPTAAPRSEQRHQWPSLPHPTACASRFSQPPGALIRSEPAGLVSCRIRSWGSPSRAFLPSCSRTSSPTPLPSWRWVNPRKPHDRNQVKSQIPRICASTWHRLIVWSDEHPPSSGCSTARESATRTDGLDQSGHVALLGLSPLQGTPPRRKGPAEAAPPLMRLAKSGASDRQHSTPGYRFQRDRLASLEAADPPGVLRLGRSRLFEEIRDPGVTSSGLGVRHRPLNSPSLDRFPPLPEPNVIARGRYLNATCVAQRVCF